MNTLRIDGNGNREHDYRFNSECPDMETYISCDVLQVGDYGAAGSIGRANINSLEETEGAWVERGSYSSEILWLPDTPGNREIIEGLERNYPLYDDEEHSKVEMEWENEAWNDYGRQDIYHRINREGYPELASVWDSLDLESQWEMYRQAMEKENEYPVYENTSAFLPIDKIWWNICQQVARYENKRIDELDDTKFSIDEAGFYTVLEVLSVILNLGEMFPNWDTLGEERLIMADYIADEWSNRHTDKFADHIRHNVKSQDELIEALTEKDVEFTLTAEWENERPEDHFTEDSGIAFVLSQIRQGNVWGWCQIMVKAEYAEWHGEDYLGGCSYYSEKDFKAGDYYKHMKSVALENLKQSALRQIRESVKV